MLLFLLLPFVGAFCVFESSTSVYWSDLTPQGARNGCLGGCANQTYPMLSFFDDEFNGSPAASCDQGPVVVCGGSKLLGKSVKSLLRNPMYRTWEQAGLNTTEGWWTNTHGSGDQYVEQAFVAPHSGTMLGDGAVSSSVVPRKWLCACLN